MVVYGHPKMVIGIKERKKYFKPLGSNLREHVFKSNSTPVLFMQVKLWLLASGICPIQVFVGIHQCTVIVF